MNELKVLQCKHIESAIIANIQGTLYTLKQLKRSLLDNEITFAEAKRKGAKNMAILSMWFDRLDKINFYQRDNKIDVVYFDWGKEYKDVYTFFGNV